MTVAMDIKRNPNGQRCDLKMTKSGKLACMGAGCQRVATNKVTTQRNSYHAANTSTLYVCEKHISTGHVLSHETNEQGYIGRSPDGIKWLGTMTEHTIVKWQERENL